MIIAAMLSADPIFGAGKLMALDTAASRGSFQSSSAPGGDAEPSARWGRLEHMGRSAGQTEMDALGDLIAAAPQK
jgi:hypothetical protein